MIHETNSYHIFKRQHANRPINDYHVRSLVESMKKYGFLSAYHIVVNTNMEVIDGQHRLEAAKISGLPVHYAVQENVDLELNRELNALTRRWETSDYLESFVTEGYFEYIKLKSFLQESELTLSSVLHISREESRAGFRNVINDYKAGHYIFPNSEFSRNSFVIMQKIKEKHDIRPTRSFTAAVYRIVSLEGFDLKIMLAKIEMYQSKFYKCHNIESYLEMLVDLYNYHAKKHRIRIN